MNLNINIMGVPNREEHILELKKELGKANLFYDRGQGIWMNRINCLKDHLNSDYGITLQDDSILCKDFLKKAEGYIKRFPNNIISFYFGKRELSDIYRRKYFNFFKEAYSDNKDYFECVNLSWGVALYIPKEHIQGIISKWDKDKKFLKFDDTRIGIYAKEKKIKIIYTIPSLVNHKQIKSEIGDNGKARVAYFFK